MKRHADLSAVGMAGKRERHAIRNRRKNVRLVGQKQHRIVGSDLRKRARQIVDAAEAAVAEPVGELIAEPGQPKPLSRRAQQHGVVFQDRYLHAGERAAHAGKIVPPIVIAEDRPGSERRLKPRQFGRPQRIGDRLPLESASTRP